MSPRLFLLWLLLASVTGWGVYQLKYLTQQQERRLSQINRTIQADQDAIDILKAEWSFLNQPAELERLAKRVLPDLEPVQGRQMVAGLASVPMKGEALQPGPRRSLPPPPQIMVTRTPVAPNTAPNPFAVPVAPPPAPPTLVRTQGQIR
jgi:hypothetical protein